MTDLERIDSIYEFALALVLTHGTIFVKTKHSTVRFTFSKNASASKKYCAYTEKAKVNSEFFHPVFDLVRHEMADHTFGENIEIVIHDKVFAVIK